MTDIYNFDQLFFGLEQNDLFFILHDSFKVYFLHPEIFQAISDDLWLQASLKKELRIQDQQFRQETQTELLDAKGLSFLQDIPIHKPNLLTLQTGRPRSLKPAGIFVLFILKGYLGSFETTKSYARIKDSVFLKELFARIGTKEIPSVQCINDALDALSHETVDLILSKQIETAREDKLICTKMLLSDSTFIQANSEFPTDSNLVFRLLNKAFNLSQRLNITLDCKVSNFPSKRFPDWLKELKSLDFEIDMTSGKKGGRRQRRKFYGDLLKRMRFVSDWICRNLDQLRDNFEVLQFSPSREEIFKHELALLEDLILKAELVHDNIIDRVYEGLKIPADQKVYSISDKDAYMVCKGQRIPIVGYRPTLTYTRNGICTDLYIIRGNPADTRTFTPLAKTLKDKFKDLESWLLDDGYASIANYKFATEELNIPKLSLSGSKGKGATPSELYESEEYLKMRKARSAVESYIGVQKSLFDMDRLSSRGLDRIYKELMAKVIASNSYRLSRLRFSVFQKSA